MMISGLYAQTEEQLKNLNDRIEAAWKTKTHQAIDSLFCKNSVDQFHIDGKVDWWVQFWDQDKDAELTIVRFLHMSDLEKLADPKSGDPRQSQYRHILDEVTKPRIMNGNSYEQNLPTLGILEYKVRRGRLTVSDWEAIGLYLDGKLLFTLKKRS